MTTAPRAPITDPLLLTAIRRIKSDGWTFERHFARYHDRDGLAIVEVVAEGAVKVWRRPVADGRSFGRPDEYPVRSVREGVDLLCALGVLPADLSSQYAAALTGGQQRWDVDGDQWRLGWHCVGSDGPSLTLAQLDGEFGPLTVERPEPIRCSGAVPIAGAMRPCGAVATARVDGELMCDHCAEIDRAAGLTVDPLDGEPVEPAGSDR